jgi:hypothetical protein
MLANLTARGAMDSGVGHSQLPVEQEAVLFLQAGESSPLERVVLNVIDALLVLPFGLGRQLHLISANRVKPSESLIRFILYSATSSRW